MGQTIGKAIKPGAIPFADLPRSLVESLRQSVYEVAEGYGLCEDELKKIVQISLHEYFVRLSDSGVDDCSEALFALLQSCSSSRSEEALIDSFEFLATICIISGMQLDEKIHFIFNLFDFNESGRLNINEATLAFRALVSGAAKISTMSASVEMDVVDKVALEGFELSMPDNLKYSQAMAVKDHSLNKRDFFDYVFNCAETISLLNHFDTLVEDSREAIDPAETSTKLEPLRFSMGVTRPSEDEPWRDQLRFLRSGGDEMPTENQSPPTDGLTLDWIHGRNAKTPAKYCSNGEAVYAAGSTIVKVSMSEDGEASQEYFMGHSGHVVSIDTFNTDGSLGDVVASADIGSGSKVCVWSLNTLCPIVMMPSFHECGTSMLSFSPSGELLLSIGNNELNSVAVYSWKENMIIFTSKVPGTDVYDSSFLASDNSFGVCTKDAVYFWTRLGPNVPYSKRRGVFNRLSMREIMTSIACVGSSVVTGSLTGRLWIWEGRVCTNLVEALRSGPITRLHAPRGSNDAGLCVATHGGSVYLLNGCLENYRRLVPNKGFGDSERVVDAIFWHPELGSVLIGQNGNGLYQLSVHDEEDIKIVTNCHSDVSDMAMRNCNIITVGRNVIKIWDATRNAALRESSIGPSLSCVSYDSQGDRIAVGFGTDGTRSSLEKSFAILDGNSLEVTHYGCNTVSALTVSGYSRDGNLLAFGSADKCIYIHDCTEKRFPLLAKAKGHTSPVCTIDFGGEKGSSCAGFLRTNSIGGEVMFWTKRGKQQTPLSQRDTLWESQTCIYTDGLEAVHNAYDDHCGRVTSRCSPSIREDKSATVGDSNGNLRVFSRPVIVSHPLFLEYSGHSGSITRIETSMDGKALFTMSSQDSCMFRWKRTSLAWEQGLPAAPLRNNTRYGLPPDGSASLDMQGMIDQMDGLDFSKSNKAKNVVRKQRPWARSIVAPTDFVPSDGPLPHSQLYLERIHGYNGNGVKNNLHYFSRDGKKFVIYSVGQTLVQYTEEKDEQCFYTAASNEIRCLAVHQNESICAIGHADTCPCVTIVDLITMKPLSFLTGHAGSVLDLDVEESGRFVVSASNARGIVVHDWRNGAAIASSRTYGMETLDLKFLKGSSDRFVECGVCFVRFWCIKGCSLSFNEVNMDSLKNHTQHYGCFGWNGDDLVVGTSSGDVVQFAEEKPDRRRIKAHQSAVTNISSTKDGFISSSLDDFKCWNSSMRCMLSISAQAIGTSHQISSIVWSEDIVLVGTTGNEIWQLSSDDGSNWNEDGKALFSSHSSSPMGLSVHPNGTCATAGDDGILRVWSPFDHQEKLSIDLGMSTRSCAFCPDSSGKMIAVGFGKPVKESARTINGKWIVLTLADADECRVIAERRDVRKYVTEMKWHSNGDRLAVGSFDRKICVYEIKTETKPAVSVDITLLSMIDLTSPPICFDFSRDGKYLRANLQSNELHFFEAGPGLHIKESSRLKDAHWETETCIFGWNVQGCHLQEDDGEILSVDCSLQHCPTIASGDKLGRLRMHQFPCTTASAQYMTYPAHLGPIGKVRWIPGGYLVSTGEKDGAIMMWRQEVDEGFATDRASDAASSAAVCLDAGGSSMEGAGETCSSALYDLTGQVVYPLSGNCLVLNKYRSRHKPPDKFQHESTVSAICVTRSRQFFASSHASMVIVWDSQICTEVAALSDTRQRQVSALSFSADDTRLASVSSDGRSASNSKQHIICVWMALKGDWKNACLILHTFAGRDEVIFCHFTAVCSDDRLDLVSGGIRHVNFWSEQHSALVLSQGVPSPQFTNDAFLCAASVGGKVVTGTESGSLVVWQEKKVDKDVQAHNGPVMSLRECPEGFVSGCARGVAVLWSADIQKIASFDVASSFSIPCVICSLDVTCHLSRDSTTKILVRTGSGDVLEISCVTGCIIPLVRERSDQKVPSVSLDPSLSTIKN